jgi:SAM-dependent methyltransferase
MQALKEKHAGYCPCCRSASTFTIHGPWLRDEYLCDRCGSIPRQRHLILILDTLFPSWQRASLHESSPSLPILAKQCSRYSYSHYFPDTPLGTEKGGIRCESIEQLTFGDSSLDFFVTQDVLEHVFRPDLALRDIHRVLKRGGAHVFTAPKHESLAASRCRARLDQDSKVEYLLPDEYHGNPVGDGKALVTWDYGSDFERLASTWVGATVATYQTVDKTRGIDAAFNEVFVIVKH